MDNTTKDIIIVKKWLAEAKARDLKAESRGYGAEFTELATTTNDNELGFVGTITRETEKAIAIETAICDVMGNERNWTVWLPKSQIIRQAKTELAA